MFETFHDTVALSPLMISVLPLLTFSTKRSGALKSGRMMNVCLAVTAALYKVLPAWFASITAVPEPVIVTVLPLMVKGPEIFLNVTGKPDEAVAARLNGASPNVLAGMVLKFIV